MLAFAALFIVLIAETGRIPVDTLRRTSNSR
jgi:hypothetical protein